MPNKKESVYVGHDIKAVLCGWLYGIMIIYSINICKCESLCFCLFHAKTMNSGFQE